MPHNSLKNLDSPLINKLRNYEPEFIEIRKNLHQNPELSREEYKTADYIENCLKSWNIETHRLIGTGIIGIIKKGQSNRNIGLRADIDALPINESNNLPYASQTPGVMHACGHDGHMTTLLMAAKYLQFDADFDGIVTLIFQPDEEDTAGAKRMIEAGLFEKFPVDTVFAYHNYPGAKTGDVLIRDGAQMAGTCTIRIKVKSCGGHAAHPYQTVDTIYVAAQIVTALQSIPSRNLSAIDSAVITIGTIHGGVANNAIPGEVAMTGTLRYFDVAIREKVKARIRELVEFTAKSYGATAEVELIDGYIPTINEPNATAFAINSIESLIKPEHLHFDKIPSMGAEDFGFMLAEKPGAYFYLGNDKTDTLTPLHTSGFDFDDRNLLIGSAIFCQLALDYLK